MYNDCPEGKTGTVEASVISNAIQRGEPVTYDCVVVTDDLGPLTMQKIKLKIGDEKFLELYNVKSPIAITNSIIQGKVNFEDVIFRSTVDFRGTTFLKEVNFMGSIFCQQCVFEGSHFQEVTHFGDLVKCNPRIDKHIRFIGGANFKKTVFEKYVDFNRAEFEESAEFSSQNRQESFNNRSIFKGHTIFSGARFKSIAHFETCEFQDVQYGAEFRGAIFKKEAYFQEATFNGYTNFLNTTFEEYTDFSNTKFSSQMQGVGFAEANFNGYVTDFRHALFNGTFANFRATKFTGEFVSFRNAKFRNITDQERACRKARRQLSNSVNRIEEDHMFYTEMEARRRQKGITKTPYPESPRKIELGAMSCYEFIVYFKDAIKNHDWSKVAKGFFLYNLGENILFQKIFGGYGIFWYWIAFWWISISVVLGIIYYISQGIRGAPCIWQCIHFSFLVAFTRGYGNYQPNSNWELVVMGETIFGLLMFGIFIASITRKYMR